MNRAIVKMVKVFIYCIFILHALSLCHSFIKLRFKDNYLLGRRQQLFLTIKRVIQMHFIIKYYLKKVCFREDTTFIKLLSHVCESPIEQVLLGVEASCLLQLQVIMAFFVYHLTIINFQYIILDRIHHIRTFTKIVVFLERF